MRVSVLCSSQDHPIFPYLEAWQHRRATAHTVELVQASRDLSGGDLLLLVSCTEIIRRPIRDKYKTSLVIHASDVPHGRGWSPHVWQVLEGKNEITVTLLEAADPVDSGAILAQQVMTLEGHELANEINAKLFAAELNLMEFACENFGHFQPRPQPNHEPPSYYRKRTPDDSRLDPHKSIAEQFELLRVADAKRYPAFFDFRGYRYKVILEKQEKVEE